MSLLILLLSVAGPGFGGAAHVQVRALPLLRRENGGNFTDVKKVPSHALFLAVREEEASKAALSLVASKYETIAHGKPPGPGPGWGTQKVTTYPDDWKQVQRAKNVDKARMQYFKFSKKPAITTFDKEIDACRACITFFPEKEDGEKYHAPIPKNEMGGEWARVCHAGPCDFRDPQTQPWGGVIGAGTEAFTDPWGSWWKPPENKQCMTKDPVFGYSDCEPILYDSMENMYDVTRFCSYQTQLSFPPPTNKTLSPWTGVEKHFTRLNSGREPCLTVIETMGPNLYSDMNSFDSNLNQLSGCCQSMHLSMMCVADVANHSGVWLKDEKGYNDTRETIQEPLELFSKYCTPLCIYDANLRARYATDPQRRTDTANQFMLLKAAQLVGPKFEDARVSTGPGPWEGEFCEHYPSSDVCIQLPTCKLCTQHGGYWCADEPVECRGPADTRACASGLQETAIACVQATPAPPIAEIPPPAPPPKKPKRILPPPIEIGPCKYLTVEKIWSQEVPRTGEQA